MNRREYVSRVAAYLRQNDVKMEVTLPRQVFHISDDEGNTRDFAVRGSKRRYIFNADELNEILDGFISVALEAMKNGETIGIHKFGILRNRFRKARTTKDINTGKEIRVAARLVPYFAPGKDMQTSVKLYQMKLEEKGEFPPDDERTDFNVYSESGDD